MLLIFFLFLLRFSEEYFISYPYFYILFLASCESPNKPVELISLESDRNFVWSGDPVELFCNAIDDDNDKINHRYTGRVTESAVQKGVFI